MSKLNDLHVGDFVTIFRRGEVDRIEKIQRKTKTMIVTISESKFDIITGNGIPRDRYSLYYPRIEPTTEEHIKIIKKCKMIDKLTSFSFNSLSYEQLENVLKVISGEVTK